VHDVGIHGGQRWRRRQHVPVPLAAASIVVLVVAPALPAAAAHRGHHPVYARAHRPAASGRGGRTSAGHVATATSSSRSPPSLTPGLGPPFTVGSETLHLFDPMRATAARGDVPASSGRVLDTDLFVPAGAAGPLPLVVFAHGWNSDPGVYAPLLTRWAQAGFLVAAPVFPDSTDLYPGSPVSDDADQALDISFVITSLLHNDALHVDPTRIAVAGHSDGGTDVALLALDPAYADPRVRAYLSLSSEMPSGIAPYAVAPTSAALLVAVGSADEYGLYPLATQVFDTAEASSKVMVVEQGGDHLGSFVGPTSAATDMREETTRFLELSLEPRPPTSADLAAALENPPSPSLTVAPG
jgi:dienelactone hydrolase